MLCDLAAITNMQRCSMLSDICMVVRPVDVRLICDTAFISDGVGSLILTHSLVVLVNYAHLTFQLNKSDRT